MSAKLLPFPPLVFPAAASLAGAVDGMPVSLQPLHRLRSMVEAGEETMPQSYPVRILQKLAAGVVECMLQSRLATLQALWSEPHKALAHRQHCRQVAGVTDDEIDRAGEMLGAAVMAACREAAKDLDFDVEEWTDVLIEVLAPHRIPRTGEVIDIETLRLIRLARRGAFDGASFADDNGDDVA